MSFRNAVLILVAALFFLGAPLSASALTPPFDVKASKNADGPYMDDSQRATIRPGKTKLFFWEVESEQLNDQSMTFDDAVTASDADYRIRWYKGKTPEASKNISSQVKGSGFPFILRGEETRYFTAKVRARQSPDTLCLGGQATNPSFPYSNSSYFAVNGKCA